MRGPLAGLATHGLIRVQGRMYGFSRFTWACVTAAITIGCLTAGTEFENREQARASLERLPLRFEANQGRASGGVRFMAHTSGYTLLLTDQGPRMRFANAKHLDL